ncbi:PRM10_2 [Sanghuangporus weigelae]
MSDGLHPSQEHRRSSMARSDDYRLGQEGLNLRRSHSGAPDNMDAYAVATGVNNLASRSTSNRSQSVYSEPDALPAGKGVDSLPGTFMDHKTSGDSFASKNFGDPDDYRRSSGVALPSLSYNMPYGEARRDSVYRNDHNNDGLVGHVKHAFARIAHNTNGPPPMDSRQNSWADAMYSGKDDKLDNFERTQAINDEVEETYLVDEGLRRRRYPQERASLDRRDSNTEIQDSRRSYRDRRKKGKHIIKYHAESTEDYQRFILLFAKALLTFGSPSHRIEAQLNSLAKVFEIEAQFQHTPGTIQVSFGNPEQKSSETCLIKSGVSLSLGRIHSVHNIYRSVLHDDMYASDGMRQLRKLLIAPPQYGQLIRYVLSFMTCFLICGVAFNGSINDMWVAGIMGFIVRVMQNIASKSDLSASGSEVFTAALVSFIARGFASYPTQIWCFSAISSSGVISLLPGYLILSGSLDIAGKNQSLGAPKIVSGIMTSLYLGFGLTLGSDLFLFLDRKAGRTAHAAAAASPNSVVIQGSYKAYNSTESGFDGTGNATLTGYFTFINNNAPTPPNVIGGCFRDTQWGWYLQPVPWWSLCFLVPLFAFCSSMNNQQHWWSRQIVVMVSIACISFWITRVCNVTLGLHNHPDYVSLIGSWLVGILGNGYSRRFGGTAFTAMLTGILLLVPDGLSAAGGLAQSNQGLGQDEYTQSLTLARKMISVIIGILAGVYSSAAIIYLFGKKKNAALVTF